jgi:SNF2 family DNA or RNA helicase
MSDNNNIINDEELKQEVNYDYIPRIPQPKSMRINLYPHQLASVYNMEQLEIFKQVEVTENIIIDTNIGINADKTGYGKTCSMIALILRDSMEWDEDPYVFESVKIQAGGRIKKRSIYKYQKVGTTLILAGQSIIHQWENEFKYTDLSVAVVTSRKCADTVEIGDYDVIIVAPGMYNKLMMANSNIAWKRFIFDEPGHVKVPSMKKIIAGFSWFVTATPYSINWQHGECRTSFMYEIFSNRANGWRDFQNDFGPFIQISDEGFINNSYSMPISQHIYHKCYNPIFSTLNGLTSVAVLDMIRSGDIQEAVRVLGGKSTDNITELVLKKKNDELKEIDTEIKICNIRCDEIKKVYWDDKKSKVLNEIVELQNRYKEVLEGNCNICMEPMINPVLEPNCQNVFCGACLLTWLRTKQNCPLCRHVVDPTKLIIEQDKNISMNSKNESKMIVNITKENKIAEILNDNPQDKVIIFSDRDYSFTSIRNILNENEIKFSEVKGSVKTRERLLKRFREGDTQVIFLNSQNNSSGINLVETDSIIVYHEMSASNLTQIIGRANRLGRKIPLKVHHLTL